MQKIFQFGYLGESANRSLLTVSRSDHLSNMLSTDEGLKIAESTKRKITMEVQNDVLKHRK